MKLKELISMLNLNGKPDDEVVIVYNGKDVMTGDDAQVIGDDGVVYIYPGV